MSEVGEERKFQFLRNGDAEPSELDWNKGIESVRQAISEAMNAKNIAFLLGAGCSSLMKDKKELGIATMAPLAKEFCGETLDARAAGFYRDPPVVGAAPAPWRLTKAELDYLDALGIDLAKDCSRNLERLMEVLFAQRFVLRQSENPDLHPSALFSAASSRRSRISYGPVSPKGLSPRRAILRARPLRAVLQEDGPARSVLAPAVGVHDQLRSFQRIGDGSPRHSLCQRLFRRGGTSLQPGDLPLCLAEQLDLTSRSGPPSTPSSILQLHGSVTWTEDDHGLFPIKEVWPLESTNQMLIYPTPAKQNSSLGSPYADLFREFQSRIVREQSVLITAGYAFSDEHLNNIIYQALTIPTFRLVIFAAPDTAGEIAKLRALRDPRIWIIGGDGPAEGTRAHYFDMIVEHFMPQRPSDRIDDAVRKVLSELAPKRDDETKDGEA